MSDDFDSGDDLFDNVDVDDILEDSQAPSTKRKSADKDGAPSRPKRQKTTTATTATSTSPLPNPQDEHVDPALDESNVQLAQSILHDKFGYDDFRHEQKGAIRRVLAGKSAFVIFPTGAGKSLCYQVRCFFFFFLKRSVPNILLNSFKDTGNSFPRAGQIAWSQSTRPVRHHHCHLSPYRLDERPGRCPEETGHPCRLH